MKKTWKVSESGVYFQVLTHDNYEQTNGIQLEFFYASPMLGLLQQSEGLSRHKRYQSSIWNVSSGYCNKYMFIKHWKSKG